MAASAKTTQEKAGTAFYENASSALLAAQPDELEPRKVSKKEQEDWNIQRGHLESRLVSLRMWRNSWWTTNWSTLAEYLLPRRSIWWTQSAGGYPTPNNMQRGRMLNTSILDPTGTYAVRVCAAGLMSGLASPSRPWFRIICMNKNFQPDADGRAWMDEIKERIYTVCARSNFYNAFAQECEDLVVFGTGPSIIYEDPNSVIRCYNPANGEYYLGTDATMRVDTLYRQFVMTVAQIVDFFGLENCPESIRSLWSAKASSLDQEWTVAHAIEPNFEIKGKGVGKIPGNFAYREVYWIFGSGSPYPLSMRGFVDPPFTAARWATQSNDAYGRSPGMDVMPDVLQLQVMTMRLSEAIEKQVRPPLQAPMELKNQPSSALPGHISYTSDTSKGIRSIYDVNPDVKGLAALIQQIEERIKVGLFNDLFLMLEQNPEQEMTAYQVAQKIQEKMQVLGPVIEGLITESLAPKLKLIYRIMDRKGMLPPMPDSMKGIALDVEFESMLAVAQKATATGGLERILAIIGNMSGVYPNVKFLLDEDLFVREFNDLLSNPNKIMRSPEAVQQMVAKAAQDAQRKQAMVEAQHGAKTASIGADAAQTLADTQIGGGQQALAALLGTNAGGAQQ